VRLWSMSRAEVARDLEQYLLKSANRTPPKSMAHPAPFDVANSPGVFRPGSQSTTGPQPEKSSPAKPKKAIRAGWVEWTKQGSVG